MITVLSSRLFGGITERAMVIGPPIDQSQGSWPKNSKVLGARIRLIRGYCTTWFQLLIGEPAPKGASR
jgi:hypothetical protein